MPLNQRRNRLSSVEADATSATTDIPTKSTFSLDGGGGSRRSNKNKNRLISSGCSLIKNVKLSDFESSMVKLACFILLIHFIGIGMDKDAVAANSRGDLANGVGSLSSWVVEGETEPRRKGNRQRPNNNDSIQLLIPSFRNNNDNDNMSFHKKSPDVVIPLSDPNYGGLQLNFLDTDSNTAWERKIIIDQKEEMGGRVYKEADYEKGWKSYDRYYAVDDDNVRNEPFNEYHKDKSLHCRRVAWHRKYSPNCNTFHETVIIPSKEGVNRLLGEGSYRAAFFLKETFDPELVIKVQRYTDKNYRSDNYEFVRNDALIMERLTASPRIVDIYGHCAVSVLTEYLPVELEPIASPYVTRRTQIKKLEEQKATMPLNNLTIDEKLKISLQMAESIADLHGFRDGVIVHDDIQMPQFLFDSNKNVKLNDFNRGEIMLFDEKRGEYCRYCNGPGGGDWRAPEEYVDGLLNEKIDVWSYGNNVYSILTGLYVFHETRDYKKIKKMIIAGKKAKIDPVYRQRSFIEQKLVGIIERCWAHNADDRISIFDIVKELQLLNEKHLRKKKD